MTPKLINRLIKPINRYRFIILASTILGWGVLWFIFLEPSGMNTSVSFDGKPIGFKSSILLMFWMTGVSFVVFSYRNLKEHPGRESSILKKTDYLLAKGFEWHGSVFFTIWFIGLMLGTLIVTFKWIIE
ncbi:hypothetical protein [Amphritea balenae]|uniref:Uncharacterized protein n=1 Tax=Amphritea balenae TaxID=452629 RepID=A0A3P1SJH9_9GAMM|nr:hypothetical protein [Amphritea balenae]RRC97216.1 hypothetical protein EHS89_18575 [Amphritea balenae]